MKRRRSRGFALAEALVAVAIAAVTLSGFYGALSVSARLERTSEAQAEAVLLATSVMDRVGIDIPLRPGTVLQDREGERTWRLTIVQGVPRDLRAGAFSSDGLLTVAVEVRGAGPDVALRSLRYAPSPL